MNLPVKNTIDDANIFSINRDNFDAIALWVFRFQHQQNAVYRQFCDTLKIDAEKVNTISKIPFLPIRFFKTHQVATTDFIPEAVFESSGTTGMDRSRHLVKELNLYSQSFETAFRQFYGPPQDWCILALLPSYLERESSSLVYMANQLIEQSGHKLSGFYLDDFAKLQRTIRHLENAQQQTLLIGVTFALLDLAALFPMPLQHTVIMETGGMKGRREEITRQEVHSILQKSFGLQHIHSEYGMTELLSQAYSKANGMFNCPPWMRVLIREEDDPFNVQPPVKQKVLSGAINIIDLTNIYSCSFIATDDAGKLYEDGSFEVQGRLDNSDIRGCSLLHL